MTWELGFQSEALDEWRKLQVLDRKRFEKILRRRLLHPDVPADRLSGNLQGCWKIRNMKSGNRLVYRLRPDLGVLEVISVGARSDKEVYLIAARRIST